MYVLCEGQILFLADHADIADCSLGIRANCEICENLA